MPSTIIFLFCLLGATIGAKLPTEDGDEEEVDYEQVGEDGSDEEAELHKFLDKSQTEQELQSSYMDGKFDALVQQAKGVYTVSPPAAGADSEATAAPYVMVAVFQPENDENNQKMFMNFLCRAKEHQWKIITLVDMDSGTDDQFAMADYTDEKLGSFDENIILANMRDVQETWNIDPNWAMYPALGEDKQDLYPDSGPFIMNVSLTKLALVQATLQSSSSPNVILMDPEINCRENPFDIIQGQLEYDNFDIACSRTSVNMCVFHNTDATLCFLSTMQEKFQEGWSTEWWIKRVHRVATDCQVNVGELNQIIVERYPGFINDTTEEKTRCVDMNGEEDLRHQGVLSKRAAKFGDRRCRNLEFDGDE